MRRSLTFTFPVDHPSTGLSFILKVSEVDYISGFPGTGPSYSCGGTPPEPAEVELIAFTVDLDGEVNELVNITSEEMDVIMQMTNDNEAFFYYLVEQSDKVECAFYDELIEKVEDSIYDEMEQHYPEPDWL